MDNNAFESLKAYIQWTMRHGYDYHYIDGSFNGLVCNPTIVNPNLLAQISFFQLLYEHGLINHNGSLKIPTEDTMIKVRDFYATMGNNSEGKDKEKCYLEFLNMFYVVACQQPYDFLKSYLGYESINL